MQAGADAADLADFGAVDVAADDAVEPAVDRLVRDRFPYLFNAEERERVAALLGS